MTDVATTTFSFTLEIDGLSARTRVARFEGEEGLSQLFQFQVLITSPDPDIPFASVIGKKALLTLHGTGNEARHVHGIVSRFAHGESGKAHNAYRVTLVPSVWRLHHRRDSRIFQDLAVPEIIEKVLRGAGIPSSDYRFSLEGAHPVRPYCVQYRESDLAFISRLMEEEGIHYFFEHAPAAHVLVMADGSSAHPRIPEPSAVAYRASLGALMSDEHVSRFVYAEEVRPGKVTLGDFNFEKPSLSLDRTTQADADTDLEVYDHPGEYDLPGDGATLARIRLQELQSARRVGEGESACPRFVPGALFSLADHPRDADNRGWLLTRVHHRGSVPQMGEASGHERESYTNDFQVVPDDVPYRPARRTARPTIKGVQTAIVVGPAGEEVHTDEHGRVKVQFHWDRQGKRDEKSSCWMRVSQVWAGASYGAMYIPRVGHEVIVDFLEGDPDRPIVVGRVYHGTNIPPYALPAEKTKSTLKSNSSKGGGGSNELRFEDKKGSEEVYLHAQKDMHTVVEHDSKREVLHDETHKVGHDRKKRVDHDQHESIGHDKTIQVTRHHTETIGGDETVTVKGDAVREVTGDVQITVHGGVTEAVTKDVVIAVDGGQEEEIGKDSKAVVGGSWSLQIGGAQKIAVTGDSKSDVQGAQKITAAKGLTITVGSATIKVEPSGAVTIQGGKITVKGSEVAIKGDSSVSVQAGGAVKIKGGGVNLN